MSPREPVSPLPDRCSSCRLGMLHTHEGMLPDMKRFGNTPLKMGLRDADMDEPQLEVSESITRLCSLEFSHKADGMDPEKQLLKRSTVLREDCWKKAAGKVPVSLLLETSANSRE